MHAFYCACQNLFYFGTFAHRLQYKNLKYINFSYQQPYDAYCPKCEGRLRLWPAKGHPFYCDQCPPEKKDILKKSTGRNRLNCFLCDYDICVDCAVAN